MHFQRISIADKKVALKWTTPVAKSKGVTTHELILPDKPLSSFTGAMQAFAGYALSLIGAPPSWDDDVKVTTLNFSEDGDGRRGVMVSISHKVEQAKGRVVSITTPVMHAAADDAGEGEAIAAPGFYGSLVADMIEAAEAEALRYQKGEREQLELMGDDATATAGDAPAKVAGNSRGGRKNRDFIPGVGPVMNADKTGTPTDENLRQLLLTVDKDVPLDAIARWSSSERDQAFKWADYRVRALVGRVKGRAPAEPLCVQRDATLSLTADQAAEQGTTVAGD